eukprot:scpid88671/ scgid18310/ 
MLRMDACRKWCPGPWPPRAQAGVPSRPTPVVTHTLMCEWSVMAKADDCAVWWDSTSQRWTMGWTWKARTHPTRPVGCGVGEYSRRSLTEEQEQLFRTEVDAWIDRGWTILYDRSIHSEPACVLPWLAQVQEQKSSTPARPCLDYREFKQVSSVAAWI